MKFMELVDRNHQRSHEERMQRRKSRSARFLLAFGAMFLAMRAIDHKRNNR